MTPCCDWWHRSWLRKRQRHSFLKLPQQISGFDPGIFRKWWCGYFTMHPYQRFVQRAHNNINMSNMIYCQGRYGRQINIARWCLFVNNWLYPHNQRKSVFWIPDRRLLRRSQSKCRSGQGRSHGQRCLPPGLFGAILPIDFNRLILKGKSQPHILCTLTPPAIEKINCSFVSICYRLNPSRTRCRMSTFRECPVQGMILKG